MSWKWHIFKTEMPTGFQAKYRALCALVPQQITPEGQFEFSVDSAFHPRHFTRYDRRLAFDSDWQLGFWNENRFNIYNWLEGRQIRRRNPFEVTWKGLLSVPLQQHASLQCDYTGKATIRIGTFTWDLPENYQTRHCARMALADLASLASSACYPHLIHPPLPATFSRDLEIFYQFSQPSWVGSSSVGPNANFQLSFTDDLLAPKPIEGIPDWSSRFTRILAFFIDLFTLALLLRLILREIQFLLSDRAVWLMAAAWTMVALFFPTGFRGLAVASIFVKMLYDRRRGVFDEEGIRKQLKQVNILLLLVLVIPWLPIDFGDPVYRSPGSDPLLYESTAREMLRDWERFWEGHQPVFTFQVFFRYHLAFLRLVFGESGQALTIFSMAMFYALIPLMVRAFATRMNLITSLLFSLLFIGLEHALVFRNVELALSEHAGWFYFLLPLLLGLAFDSSAAIFAVPFFLGLSTITRLNFVLGNIHLLVGLFALVMIRTPEFFHRPYRKPAFFGIFIGVYLLIPVHNLYYGNQLAPLPLHISSPAVQTLPVHKIFQAFSDPEVKQYLKRRFDLYTHFFSKPALNAVMTMFLLSLLIQGIISFHTRSKTEWLNLFLLGTPFSFMVVHLFFALGAGYPRFVVPHFLLMYFFPVLVFGPYLDRFLAYCRGYPTPAAENSPSREAP
jgi:hypothetical protein